MLVDYDTIINRLERYIKNNPVIFGFITNDIEKTGEGKIYNTLSSVTTKKNIKKDINVSHNLTFDIILGKYVDSSRDLTPSELKTGFTFEELIERNNKMKEDLKSHNL